MFRNSLRVLGLVAILPTAALAEPVMEIGVTGTKLIEPLATAMEADGLGDFLDLDIATEDDLQTARGGIGVQGDVQINEAQNNADASGNTLVNTSNGAITNTSLDSVKGNTVVMQNTGNNVNMQSITQYNIIMNQ